MVKLYARLVIMGTRTIDEVPEKFREAVLEEIERQKYL